MGQSPGGFLTGMWGVIGPQIEQKYTNKLALQQQEKQAELARLYDSSDKWGQIATQLRMKGSLTDDQAALLTKAENQILSNNDALAKLLKGDKELGPMFEKFAGLTRRVLRRPAPTATAGGPTATASTGQSTTASPSQTTGTLPSGVKTRAPLPTPQTPPPTEADPAQEAGETTGRFYGAQGARTLPAPPAPGIAQYETPDPEQMRRRQVAPEADLHGRDLAEFLETGKVPTLPRANPAEEKHQRLVEALTSQGYGLEEAEEEAGKIEVATARKLSQPTQTNLQHIMMHYPEDPNPATVHQVDINPRDKTDRGWDRDRQAPPPPGATTVPTAVETGLLKAGTYGEFNYLRQAYRKMFPQYPESVTDAIAADVYVQGVLNRLGMQEQLSEIRSWTSGVDPAPGVGTVNEKKVIQDAVKRFAAQKGYESPLITGQPGAAPAAAPQTTTPSTTQPSPAPGPAPGPAAAPSASAGRGAGAAPPPPPLGGAAPVAQQRRPGEPFAKPPTPPPTPEQAVHPAAAPRGTSAPEITQAASNVRTALDTKGQPSGQLQPPQPKPRPFTEKERRERTNIANWLRAIATNTNYSTSAVQGEMLMEQKTGLDPFRLQNEAKNHVALQNTLGPLYQRWIAYSNLQTIAQGFTENWVTAAQEYGRLHQAPIENMLVQDFQSAFEGDAALTGLKTALQAVQGVYGRIRAAAPQSAAMPPVYAMNEAGELMAPSLNMGQIKDMATWLLIEANTEMDSMESNIDDVNTRLRNDRIARVYGDAPDVPKRPKKPKVLPPNPYSTDNPTEENEKAAQKYLDDLRNRKKTTQTTKP